MARDKVLNRNYEARSVAQVGQNCPPVQVLLCSAQGEGANQWKDERIRQVAATCCLHVVALIALPKPVRDVCECTFGWPPRQLDGVRIVPIRHSLRFFGMLARRKKAFCGDGQPISEVYLSFLQSDVGTRAYSQMGCRGHITPRT